MKKYLFAFVALALFFAFAACTPENSEKESKCLAGAVDLGIVMTREDGTTYKLYWAKSNLSKSGLCANPEDYGDYYAWGETAPKGDYSYLTHKWGNSSISMTKYNTDSFYGTVDNKTVLDSEDDAAHVKLGGKWRMPTDAEWAALRKQCTWTWTTQNGINGRLVTASNGNSIFLPAAGARYGSDGVNVGSDGDYWSSSLYTDGPDRAWYVGFYYEDVGVYRYFRASGFSIRPVTE